MSNRETALRDEQDQVHQRARPRCAWPPAASTAEPRSPGSCSGPASTREGRRPAATSSRAGPPATRPRPGRPGRSSAAVMVSAGARRSEEERDGERHRAVRERARHQADLRRLPFRVPLRDRRRAGRVDEASARAAEHRIAKQGNELRAVRERERADGRPAPRRRSSLCAGRCAALAQVGDGEARRRPGRPSTGRAARTRRREPSRARPAPARASRSRTAGCRWPPCRPREPTSSRIVAGRAALRPPGRRRSGDRGNRPVRHDVPRSRGSAARGRPVSLVARRLAHDRPSQARFDRSRSPCVIGSSQARS